ncbi:MAG: hypothetical protein HDR45_06250 [Bacteroides sp.]|nr:hypothetical protein [Bacteroides sp.]
MKIKSIFVLAVLSLSVFSSFARDFYAVPCEKTNPIVAEHKLTEDYYGENRGFNTFVVQLQTVDVPAIVKGNFLNNVEMEKSDKSIVDIDGIVYPYNNAVSTCHKDVLKALAGHVSKYIVDGKVVTERELYDIPAYMYEYALVSGNTLKMKLRKNKDELNATLDNLHNNEADKYQIAHDLL